MTNEIHEYRMYCGACENPWLAVCDREKKRFDCPWCHAVIKEYKYGTQPKGSRILKVDNSIIGIEREHGLPTKLASPKRQADSIRKWHP